MDSTRTLYHYERRTAGSSGDFGMRTIEEREAHDEEQRQQHRAMVGGWSNRQKYGGCLVSFVDVLGLKNLIANSPPTEILKVLGGKDSFNLQRVWQNTGYPPQRWPLTYNFSDLIVNVLG